MISINLTFFVQLVLYGIFLAVAWRFMLRPAMRHMDAREEGIQSSEAQAAKLTEEAEELEGRYAESLAEARRMASAQVAEERRKAMDARNAEVQEARTRADAEVADVRGEAQNQIEQQRQQFSALAADLKQAMAARIRSEEDAA